MKTEATPEQISYAKNFLAKGLIGHRGDFDGDYYSQLFGIIGQVIISDLLQVPRPVNFGLQDDGKDIYWKENWWDIKTTNRNTAYKNYCHNLSGYQVNYNNAGYIFLSYDRTSGEFTICGYILKEDFKQHAKFYPKGSMRPRTDGTFMEVKGESGMWEIEDKFLTRFINQEVSTIDRKF